MGQSELAGISVTVAATLYDVVKCIDRSARISICLVVNDTSQLIATLTDGDIRRALLAGLGLDSKVEDILPMKGKGPHPSPVTAPLGTSPEALLAIMQQNAVRQLPLVDGRGQVRDVVLLNDLTAGPQLPVEALIMAGGFGQRLRPLTEETPKPMLSLGGRPLLERIVRQLRDVGIQIVYVSTCYKPEKIREHFGDGSLFGVSIRYLHESRPLGTAGVLGMMPPLQHPLLVINGDILTEVDFRALAEHHQRRHSMMTVAVRLFGFEVPYGVVTCEGENVRGVIEKPRYSFFVNAGIYLIEPGAFEHIPRGDSFDMTDLIHWLLRANKKVTAYPIIEYWLDIGKHADYEQAQQDLAGGILGNDLEQ